MITQFVIDQEDLNKLFKIEDKLSGAKAHIRRRVLNRLAKNAMSNVQSRTQAQADVDGRPYPPHARKRRRRMLTRLVKRLKVIEFTDNMIAVGFNNPVEKQIGAKQQYGFTETVKKSDFIANMQRGKRRENRLKLTDPASRRQAQALLDAGFKRREKGKGLKTPTQKWIMSNMTVGQAGLILRLLRGSNEFWTTVLPPRSFLGANAEEVKAMLQDALRIAQDELSAALKV